MVIAVSSSTYMCYYLEIGIDAAAERLYTSLHGVLARLNTEYACGRRINSVNSTLVIRGSCGT